MLLSARHHVKGTETAVSITSKQLLDRLNQSGIYTTALTFQRDNSVSFQNKNHQAGCGSLTGVTSQ